ncbi:MAG: iron dependent repressor, metal binding and dimerization domain protein [Bacillota bacterium]|jgi:DtxR family Mn-dependent transcriptional regulator
MPKSGGREFRTVRGYQLLRQASRPLTPSMEDYLEMLYRCHLQEGYARVSQLADMLNVQAPSVSRVIQKLRELGYVDYEKYGVIRLTEQGIASGRYLLARHETVEQFLRNVGAGDAALEETELMEHHLGPGTVRLLETLNRYWARFPERLREYEEFRRTHGREPSG